MENLTIENPIIENQTRMYLFDLMSTARENGFKGDDNWELMLGTEAQMTRILKDYYPAIATKIFPEILLQVFYTIKSRLHQALNKEEQSLDARTIMNSKLNYVIAFNPKRHRR
jgi:hypothetical protein